MPIDRWLNIVTVAVCAAVFATLALAFVIPPRKPDRMGAALCTLFATWATIFVVALFEMFGWLPVPQPAWVQWVIRLTLILFGVAAVVEMIRGGAFGHGGRPQGGDAP